MRIVIDMQGSQSHGNRHRGIGRYVFEFAKAVCRNRGRHEIYLALNAAYPDTVVNIRRQFKGLLPDENIRVWQAPGPLHHLDDDHDGRREIAERVRLHFLNSIEPDVVVNGAVFESISEDSVVKVDSKEEGAQFETAAVLYDLIPLIRPKDYLKGSEKVERWYMQHLEYLKKCSLLLAISNSSRQEAIEYLKWPEDRVVNISSAVGSEFFPEEVPETKATLIRAKFGLTKPFVMYTGGMDQRKNVDGLIESFGLLPEALRSSHQLAIVCKLTSGQIETIHQIAKKANLPSDSVVLTGFVTDDELLSLYRLCKLFVFPSRHEGFGLPLLEAMSCGKAVLGGNQSAMPEVIGNPDALFAIDDHASASEKMAALLVSDELRAKFEEQALTQSREFSWDKTAQRAIVALEANSYSKNSPSLRNGTALDGAIRSICNQQSRPIEAEYWMQLASCLDLAFSPKPRKKKHIFVDVTELARRDARTGIQRVVRSILLHWLKTPDSKYEIKPVRSDDSRLGYVLANEFLAKFIGMNGTSISDEPLAFYPGDIFLGLDLQPGDVFRQRSYFEKLRVWGVKTKFVVYDLLPIQFPSCFGAGADAAHRNWLAVVGESDEAICISKSVADELKDYQKNNQSPSSWTSKVSWFHLGADIDQSAPSSGLPEDATDLLEHLETATTFLMVGTLEPRKGHEQVLDAFDLLWRGGNDCNLVIVGKAGWSMDQLKARLTHHSENGKRVFWIDSASDEYLSKIYQKSDALIAASVGEGFGLPLIEAAQRGIPIIARDIPVFREVAGEFAFYFNADTPEALASDLRRWTVQQENRMNAEPSGLKWLTWAQSASLLRDIVVENAT